ncbi:hypothetical protein BHE74_00036567 [Ensete ventricosum]|nr:hypothetical protein BHE74_00036567 [Ensete ventricosum]
MAFSYFEHHPSLIDCAYLPCMPTEISFLPQQVGDGTSASSCFLHCYSSDDNQQLPGADARNLDSSDSVDIAVFLRPSSVVDQISHTPMVDEPNDEKAPKQQASGEKKRKSTKDETSFITGRPKLGFLCVWRSKEGNISKHRRPHGGLRESNDKKLRADGDMKASKPRKVIPAGCIHVRARRGEATDSHSLAERVRREKITERMKVLQSLVPGCEKVRIMKLHLSFSPISRNHTQAKGPLPFLRFDLSITKAHSWFPTTDENRGTLVPAYKLNNILFQNGSSFLMHAGEQRQGLLSQAEDVNTCSSFQ